MVVSQQWDLALLGILSKYLIFGILALNKLKQINTAVRKVVRTFVFVLSCGSTKNLAR